MLSPLLSMYSFNPAGDRLLKSFSRSSLLAPDVRTSFERGHAVFLCLPDQLRSFTLLQAGLVVLPRNTFEVQVRQSCKCVMCMQIFFCFDTQCENISGDRTVLLKTEVTHSFSNR